MPFWIPRLIGPLMLVPCLGIATELAPPEAGLALAMAADDACSEGPACAVHALQLRARGGPGAPPEARGCRGFGSCGLFVPEQACQCDVLCGHFGNCCSDAAAACPALALIAGSRPSWNPQQRALLRPSTAPAHTFYMYRAQSNESYPLENVNAGNLAGTMWYIQNEIVSGKWGSTDRFGVSRIRRLKVTTRATQPLADKNMNFGLRVAFDSGKCTNGGCEYDWWLYGFNVGCNNLGEYPFPMFPTLYPKPIWYSLPGQCPDLPYWEHNASCALRQPGGHCQGTPTGQGNCTYSYEEAGDVALEELYSGTTKRAFWAGAGDARANARRVRLARERFEAKYPGAPTEAELEAPPCDFDREAFFTCEQCA